MNEIKNIMKTLINVINYNFDVTVLNLNISVVYFYSNMVISQL